MICMLLCGCVKKYGAYVDMGLDMHIGCKAVSVWTRTLTQPSTAHRRPPPCFTQKLVLDCELLGHGVSTARPSESVSWMMNWQRLPNPRTRRAGSAEWNGLSTEHTTVEGDEYEMIKRIKRISEYRRVS